MRNRKVSVMLMEQKKTMGGGSSEVEVPRLGGDFVFPGRRRKKTECKDPRRSQAK